MEKRLHKCSSRKDQVEEFHMITEAIQMLDDFIENRNHVVGYDKNDLDILDLQNNKKNEIKATLDRLNSHFG